MTKYEKENKFDLEHRTLLFSKNIIKLCKTLHQNLINKNQIEQVIRSAGSIGANYREANDALGKKDFLMRIKIARKEAKETIYWLNLLASSTPNASNSINILLDEANQLKRILSSIIIKFKN